MGAMWHFEPSETENWEFDVVLTDGTRIGSIRRIHFMNYDYWTTAHYMVSTNLMFPTRREAGSQLYARHKERTHG